MEFIPVIPKTIGFNHIASPLLRVEVAGIEHLVSSGGVGCNCPLHIEHQVIIITSCTSFRSFNLECQINIYLLYSLEQCSFILWNLGRVLEYAILKHPFNYSLSESVTKPLSSLFNSLLIPLFIVGSNSIYRLCKLVILLIIVFSVLFKLFLVSSSKVFPVFKLIYCITQLIKTLLPISPFKCFFSLFVSCVSFLLESFPVSSVKTLFVPVNISLFKLRDRKLSKVTKFLQYLTSTNCLSSILLILLVVLFSILLKAFLLKELFLGQKCRLETQVHSHQVLLINIKVRTINDRGFPRLHKAITSLLRKEAYYLIRSCGILVLSRNSITIHLEEVRLKHFNSFNVNIALLIRKLKEQVSCPSRSIAFIVCYASLVFLYIVFKFLLSMSLCKIFSPCIKKLFASSIILVLESDIKSL